MKLTRIERWILSNQLMLLEILDEDNRAHYEQSRNIIENGYEYLYDGLIPYIAPEDVTISVAKSRKVINILDMFRGIISSIKKLEDTVGIDESVLQFHGFDGNYESEYLVFAEFFCKEYDGGRYPEVVEHLESFNTHGQTLDSYNRMLEVWNSCNKKFELTKDDLLKIQEAVIHPSNR